MHKIRVITQIDKIQIIIHLKYSSNVINNKRINQKYHNNNYKHYKKIIKFNSKNNKKSQHLKKDLVIIILHYKIKNKIKRINVNL